MADFPKTEAEALALLYVQSRDVSEMTPEEIVDLFRDARFRIDARIREKGHQ